MFDKRYGGRDLSKNTELKNHNIYLIRQCFYDGQIWTKYDLSQKIGLSLALTTNILQFLLSSKEIICIGEADSTGGRKRKQYILNKDNKHIGMVILKKYETYDGFHVLIYDLLKNLLFQETYICQRGDYNELLEVVKKVKRTDEFVSIWTFSIPGVCKEGKIDICDFHQLAGIDIVQMFEKEGIDVCIENDVNVASIGLLEQYPHIDHLALLYQPAVKYIGCGMMIDHKLYKGFSHFAGELSYIPFLTFQQQDEMLEKNPNELLLYQLVTLCSIMNPEVIGVCSDVIDCFDLPIEKYLLKQHQPHIVFIKDLDQLIQDGLFYLGKKEILGGERYE